MLTDIIIGAFLRFVKPYFFGVSGKEPLRSPAGGHRSVKFLGIIWNIREISVFRPEETGGKYWGGIFGKFFFRRTKGKIRGVFSKKGIDKYFLKDYYNKWLA